MAKYIDKDALVAEIEKRIVENKKKQKKYECSYYLGKFASLEDILPFMDTLEVKEVDLESYNKVKKVLSLLFMQFLDSHRQEGKMCLSNGECFDIDKAFDELDFAKLFRYMEKYLKAQKGE